MTGGIPAANSYERIMSLIDKDELNSILLDFFKGITIKLNPEVNLIATGKIPRCLHRNKNRDKIILIKNGGKKSE